MPTQAYSNEMVENLATAFPRRAENSFAWGNAISYYLGLPQLRGFWPMSSVNELGSPYDLSGQGRTLTNGGAAIFQVYGLQANTLLNGVNQYHERASEAGLSITGSFTVGGWFRNAGIVNNYGLMSKFDITGNQRTFLLRSVAGITTFYVSPNGIAQPSATSTSAIAANQWYFACGRFVANTSIDVYVQNTKTSLLAGVPAAAFASAAPFDIGVWWGGGIRVEYYVGNSCLNFLCADACSDTQINALYWLTRPLFYGT